MRIGIDCHTLEINNWAGKEQLTASLIRELSLMDLENEYYLYFRRSVKEFSVLPPNFYLVNLNFPTPFWQFAVIFDMLKRKLKVLYVPCTYLLPAINFFVPQVVNICDLTTFLPGISDTHKKSTKLRERLLLKMAIKNSSKITVISQSTKNDLLRFFKVSDDQIAILYPGAKSDFRKISDQGLLKNISDKYALPKKFVLSVGTLEPRKNGINLIKGFEEYIKTEGNLDLHLVFIGKKGWFYDSLLAQANSSSLRDRIIFLDYVKDGELAVFYNLAFCLVYPSFYEGFGLPIVEAMACGCPVIAANTSSMPEISGPDAILVDPNQPSQISEGIKKLSSNGLLRQKFIDGGLLRSKLFTYKEMAGQWLNLIKNNFS